MNSKKGLIAIILSLVLLLGGAFVLYSRLSDTASPDQLAVQEPETVEPESGTAEGEAESEPQQIPAPDFTVYDAEGNEVHLQDFFGKPIVLNFWASWCGPCQMEMPDFHEQYLAIGDEVHFLMVNMTSGRETQESAESFIAEKGYTFPVFFDMASNAAMTYRAYSLPTTYFIDAEGFAIAQATGAIDGATLQRGIDLIRN